MHTKKLMSLIAISLLAAFGATVRSDASTIDGLKGELNDLNQLATDIQNMADGEKRQLTKEEAEKIDQIFAEFATIEKDLQRRERILANDNVLSSRTGRQTTVDGPSGAQAGAGQPGNGAPGTGRDAPVWRQPRDTVMARQNGFNHFGEFAMAVYQGGRPNAQIDPRLGIQNAPTTYGNEGVGADGAFAVPPEFRDEIMVLVNSEDELLSRTDGLTSNSNSLTIPTDETTDWQSSGGIQAFWDGEADQMTQSKPALKERSLRLNRLTALVPMTDELLEDASAMESYLRKKAPPKLNFKISNAIVNGNGAGQPEGFMNSGALVTVAKEGGQTADTIVVNNINKMWARMYAPARRNAIWLINQDVESELDNLTVEGTSSSTPVYVPPGGLSAAPYASLKGRPVIPHQVAQTLGDLGDISLVDLQAYMTILKTGGMRTDVSIHLWFDYNMTAFRFVMRVAGETWLSAPITPLNGSNTLSPFVTLAARA